MTIPLRETDRLYDGITNHRANFENVYRELGSAHNLTTGKHDKLRFTGVESQSPEVPNVKLFYNEKRSGALQVIDGVGQQKELGFFSGTRWDRTGLLYKQFFDLSLKNIAFSVVNGGQITDFFTAGPGVFFRKSSGTRKPGKIQVIYDRQNTALESKWFVQILPWGLDSSGKTVTFRVRPDGVFIVFNLDVIEIDNFRDFYNFLLLNWVKYV